MAESGIRDFNFPDWIAVTVPAGTPRPIIERLNRELSRAVHSPNVKKAFADNAFVPLTSTPDELTQIVERDLKFWRPVLKSLGVKQE
jgi:tripartite-type tricarboxylate transporter receptor subunit TctC